MRSNLRLVDEDLQPTPVMPWRDFRKWFAANWEQGQHVTMIGPTGFGKTTLIFQIVGLRSYVVIIGVKGRDETMERFLDAGYIRLRRWNPDIDDYVVLWPEVKGFAHQEKQREAFSEAFDSIYRSGGWCVVMDEVSYLSDTLRMEGQLKFLLNQGRSSGISVVAATQRAAFIPLAFYDQASHLFFFRDNDHRNLQRVGELSGLARNIVPKEVAGLTKYEFLYLNKDTGERIRTKVEE